MGLAQRNSVNLNEFMPRRSRYQAPSDTNAVSLKELLAYSGRQSLAEKQFDLLRGATGAGGKDDVPVFYSGDKTLLQRKCVSIVGTRDVSHLGWQRAAKLASKLTASGVVIVSGLAKGVDTAALTSAIASGGKTIGIIGTPLSKAYPIENAELHQTIWRDHLLMTPFAEGQSVFKSNFPKRNRVMAAISDATVIIEASDTSGTLHQAAECARLGRWLFIAKSVVDDDSLEWPKRFLKYEKCAPLTDVSDITSQICK